jgi:hypothetical protein
LALLFSRFILGGLMLRIILTGLFFGLASRAQGPAWTFFSKLLLLGVLWFLIYIPVGVLIYLFLEPLKDTLCPIAALLIFILGFKSGKEFLLKP